MKIAIGALFALLAFTASPARAEGAEAFAGVFAHDVNLGVAVCCYEHGADLQFGVRSDPVFSLNRLGDLRLYAMGSVNTNGGVDFAAAGLAWRLHLTQKLYLQPAIGAAVQDGEADNFQRSPNRLDLGSRFLFEPEITLGYHLTPRWAAELAYIHLSHAQLAGPQNPGMDDLGLRLVYRFAH